MKNYTYTDIDTGLGRVLSMVFCLCMRSKGAASSVYSVGHDNMALGGVRSALSGLSDLRKEKAEEKENLW